VQIPEQLPDFRGMNLRDALLLLEKMGIAVKLQGTGKIIRQSVRPGTALKTVATLTLELS
jgi:cell division protein FtsI (penicillin-binding protein 3)